MVPAREITKRKSIFPPQPIGSLPVSSDPLPTPELSVVVDEVLPVELVAPLVVFPVVEAVVPELPLLVASPVPVPVDSSAEVETDPLIGGVVVNAGGASVGAHAISQVIARHAKSGDGEVESKRRLRPTLRVSARF